MKIFDLKFFQFLFLIIPFALVHGSSLPNIIVTIIVIYYLSKNYKIFFDIPFYFKIFFAFVFYLIFISLISETVLFSLESSFAYIRYGLLILAIPYILSEKKIIKIFFYILYFLFLILFLDLLIQFIYKKNILGIENFNSERISGMFGRRQVAGSYALRLTPVILFLISMFVKKEFLYKCLLIIISLGIIILSGERTSLFLFLLFVCFAILVEKNYNFLITIVFIVLISLAALFYLMPVQKKRFFSDTINQLTFKDNPKKYYLFSERHQSHYLTAFNLFKENLLFGSGPNSFRHLCGTEKYSVEKIIYENSLIRAPLDGKILFDQENIFLTENNSYRYTYTDIEIRGMLIKNGEIFQTIIIPKKSKIFHANYSNFNKGDILVKKDIPYNNGCNTHPHNFFFQILGETGFFGFLFYFFFYTKLFGLF